MYIVGAMPIYCEILKFEPQIRCYISQAISCIYIELNEHKLNISNNV